jgi:phosphopantetheinyl transferase
MLSDDSLKLLHQRKSEIHKKQFLAIRNILKELSIDDQDLVYDESGKPSFRDGQNISFSHSDIYASVIIGKQVVGIDIEIRRDRILKIKEKFLGIELNYPGDLNADKALIYWNIKESIFKTVGNSGIDFRKNILVLPLDMNNNYIKSWYLNDDQIDSYNSYYKISKNYTLAYVIKG